MSDAIADIIGLLGHPDEGQIAFIARRIDDRHIVIEDGERPDALLRSAVTVPNGLLTHVPSVIWTRDVRISLVWTQLLGARPDSLAAVRVDESDHYIVLARRRGAPKVDDLARAARLLARVLAQGESTARKRESSRHFEALIDALPAPVVFVDGEDFAVFLNQPARGLLGLGAMAPSAQVAARLAQVLDGAETAIKAMLRADPKASGRFEVYENERTYLIDTLAVDQQGLRGRIWLFGDISDVRCAQAQLAAAGRLLELTVENVIEGVALLDCELRLSVWNTSFVSLLDLPDDKVVAGVSYLELVEIVAGRGDIMGYPGGLAAHARQSVANHDHVDMDIARSDGSILHFRRISIEGGRSLLGLRDVTEERQAARLKDEIISNVSHELRTPLTAITGSLAMLGAGVAGVLPDAAAQLVAVAHRNGERLNRLVDDLLDMDRLRSGKAELRFQEVDLASLLREAVEQNGPYALKFDVHLDLQADTVIASVDPDRMLQVMANLLSNAAKFSPPRGTVSISLAMHENQAVIAVADDGKGMAPEFRRRIFDRFSQEAHIGNGQASSGLGLAITKAIIELHGGTIEVESQLGVGTTFVVNLPSVRRQDLASP